MIIKKFPLNRRAYNSTNIYLYPIFHEAFVAANSSLFCIFVNIYKLYIVVILDISLICLKFLFIGSIMKLEEGNVLKITLYLLLNMILSMKTILNAELLPMFGNFMSLLSVISIDTVYLLILNSIWCKTSLKDYTTQKFKKKKMFTCKHVVIKKRKLWWF